MIGVKVWYCDSAYRYTMTDALQPAIRRSDAARRPPGDPKADRRRYLLLGHGSHLVDTARFLAGDITAVQARLVERDDIFSWFVACEFADGASGHLDLTIPVRMDWFEGFQVYGSEGSVLGRAFQPWYLRTTRGRGLLGPDGPVRAAARARRALLAPPGRGLRGDHPRRRARSRARRSTTGSPRCALLEAIERSAAHGPARRARRRADAPGHLRQDVRPPDARGHARRGRRDRAGASSSSTSPCSAGRRCPSASRRRRVPRRARR